jgi:poly-beta-hydroxybutyrate-responsive repressor
VNEKQPERPRGGLPRDYLRAGLLLLIAEAPAHGYDLLEHISELGFRTNDPGGLYRALRAMEGEGYVESSWDHQNAGPPRRTYRLSKAGAEHLHAWADALRDASRSLDSYLARYDELAGQWAGSRGSRRRVASP